MWYVILFPNEDTVSVIPSTWYIDATEECFWPPEKEKKDIDILVKRMCLPADHWKAYNAKILGKFDDYKTASAKLIKAKEKDKLSSTDMEDLGKGRRKKARKLQHRSSSTGSDSDVLLRYPSPDWLSDVTRGNGRKRFRKSRSLSPVSNTESPQNVTSQKNLSSNDTLIHSNRSSESRADKNSIMMTIMDTLKKMQAAEGEFRVQIFRKLSVMNNKLNDLWEAVEQLKGIDHENEPMQLAQQFNIFPLNEEAMEKIENDLSNEELTINLAKHLSLVGGANTAEIVRRLMYKVFTNEVGCQYSWEGAKGKKKFKNLKMYNVILNAVRFNKYTRESTEAEIIFGIKKWLVRAKDRLRLSVNSRLRINEDDAETN